MSNNPDPPHRRAVAQHGEDRPPHMRPKDPPKTVETQSMPVEVRRALAGLSGTRNGQTFLRWVSEYCGYKYSMLTMTSDGHLLKDAIVHNATKHATWIDIRKHIPAEHLNTIEKEPLPDEDKTLE